MFANGEQKSETVVKYDPSCVSVAPDGSRVVVGSSDKKKVHTFLLEAGAYTLAKNKATEPNRTLALGRAVLRCAQSQPSAT